MRLTRNDAQRRELFKAKASQIKDQRHYDAILHSFPPHLRDEIHAEVQPHLSQPFEMISLRPRSPGST